MIFEPPKGFTAGLYRNIFASHICAIEEINAIFFFRTMSESHGFDPVAHKLDPSFRLTNYAELKG